MARNERTTAGSEDEHLVLGRVLMDQGFRDLFRHDPHRAATQLGISLPADGVERIQRLLTRMSGMDARARGEFTSKLNSMERWKQA